MGRWVLKKVVQGVSLYLVDYKRPPGDGRLWDADPEAAESFHAALDAIEMSRRLSYLLGVSVQVAAMPGRDGPGGPVQPDEGPGGGTLLQARYDARDRLCAAIMCAELDDEEDYDQVERQLAELYMTSPRVIRAMREGEVPS